MGTRDLSASLIGQVGFEPSGKRDRRDLGLTFNFRLTSAAASDESGPAELKSNSHGLKFRSGKYSFVKGSKILTVITPADRGWNSVALSSLSLELNTLDGPKSLSLKESTDDIGSLDPLDLGLQQQPLKEGAFSVEYVAKPREANSAQEGVCRQNGAYLLDAKGTELDVPVVNAALVGDSSQSSTVSELRITVGRPSRRLTQPLALVIELCGEHNERWVYQQALSKIPDPASSIPLSLVALSAGSVILGAPETGEPVPENSAWSIEEINPASSKSGLKKGTTVSVFTKGPQARFVLPCSCESLRSVKRLVIAQVGGGGRALNPRFEWQNGAVVLCPIPFWLWLARQIQANWQSLVLVLSGLGLLLITTFLTFAQARLTRESRDLGGRLGTLNADLGSLKQRLENSMATSHATPHGTALDPILKVQEVRDELLEADRRLREELLSLLSASALRGGDSSPGDGPQLDDPTRPSGWSSGATPEATLVALLNESWQTGSDPKALVTLSKRQGLAVDVFRSADTSAAMGSITNRKFRFVPAQGGGSWIGLSKTDGRDLLLAPVHRRLFQTADSLKFLSILFDGLGSDLEVGDFQRLIQPCTLRLTPGTNDNYTLVSKGRLDLAAPAFSSGSQDLWTNTQPAPLAPKVTEELPGRYQSEILGLVERRLKELGLYGDRVPLRQESNGETSRLRIRVEQLEDAVSRLNSLSSSPTLGLRSEYATPPDSRNEAEERFLRSSLADESSGLAQRAARSSAVDQPPASLRPGRTSLANEEKGGAPAVASPQSGRSELVETQPSAFVIASGASSAPFSKTDARDVESLLSRLAPDWPSVLSVLFPLNERRIRRTPTDYLEALIDLRKKATVYWGDSGWRADLVHFYPPDLASSREPRLRIANVTSVASDCRSVASENGQLSDALLFQLIVRLSRPDSRSALVFPALGLPIERYEAGYRALLGGAVPEGSAWIGSVSLPAVLRPHSEEGFFAVAQKMQLEFGY